MKSQEFFINGNTDPQEYKSNTYYNYGLERIDVATRNKNTQLRLKYEVMIFLCSISCPQLFKLHRY